MLFELRQYRTRPKKRADWVDFMENEIIPFQISKGMVVVGSFVGEDEEDLYVWIRRFESESDRDRLYKAVYESDQWKEYFAPRIDDFLDRKKNVIKRLEPTAKSIIR